MSDASPNAGSAQPDPHEQPFGDLGPDYRTLPDLKYLFDVARRHALTSLLLLLMISPFVLFGVMNATSLFQSSQIIRFDAYDDQDLLSNSLSTISYDDAMALLNRDLASEDFFAEVERRFYPNQDQADQRASSLISKVLNQIHKPSDPNAPPARLRRSRALAKAILVSPLTGTSRNAALIRLTAKAGTPADAQRLAATTAQTLIDRYYKEQADHLRVLHEAMDRLLHNDQIKDLAQKAKDLPSSPHAGGPGGQGNDGQQDALQRRMRQKEISERMVEINAELAAKTTQRAKLEEKLAEVSLRYGPYHPQVLSLRQQILELKQPQSAKNGLNAEERSLKQELLSLEAESGGAFVIGHPLDTPEDIGKTIKRLMNRQDHYLLETVKIEQQLQNPNLRTRLIAYGSPTNESSPIAAGGKKALILGVAAALGLIFGLALLREVLSDTALDKWRITWRLNLPCLVSYAKSQHEKIPALDPIQIAAAKEAGLSTEARKLSTNITSYRRLSCWLKNRAHGRVVLLAHASNNASHGPFIDAVANVLACDYAGRHLVIDLDTRDPVHVLKDPGSASLFDVLAKRKTLEQAILKRDETRAYDYVRLPSEHHARLSEYISSANFAAFLASAKSTYATVLINGLGADHFVENGILTARASDTIIIVHAKTTRISAMAQLCQQLPRDKLRGYVLLSA